MYGRSWFSNEPTPVASASHGDAVPPSVPATPSATAAAVEGLASGPANTSAVLQGRTLVHTALIDFAEPDRRFGDEAYNNSLRRGEQCNAFLVRFDLDKLGLPPRARVTEATVSFYVWDPSSAGNTKVCAFPLKTAWDPETVTWRQPIGEKSWREATGFAFGADAGPAGPAVVVKPEQESDTADPPIEYQLDVTDIVRGWLEGGVPDHGLAIAPVIDTRVDEGTLTRFQVYGSQHGRAQFTPKLTVKARQ